MALKAQSLFLYGYVVDVTNQYIDWKDSSSNSFSATVPFGNYSLQDLCLAISVVMNASDPVHIYTVAATRTFSGGLQNRVTISTTDTGMDLLFGTGPHVSASIAPLIGFAAVDRTPNPTYTGTLTTGTALVTTMAGYNYSGPARDQKVFGSVSVSTSGRKEAIIFQIQQFVSVNFKYEPEAIIDSSWQPFMVWAIQQKAFEFTPEYTNPTVVYNVTLEQTPQNAQGLAFQMVEQISEFPFVYTTGDIRMRIKTT